MPIALTTTKIDPNSHNAIILSHTCPDFARPKLASQTSPTGVRVLAGPRGATGGPNNVVGAGLTWFWGVLGGVI